ncbi:MAG: NAD/NADP octopine/nopaline dehydrogenase family protein [Pseudomonadota bacterium]
MKVGIAGAGSVAFGTAALLEDRGHRTCLWSPSGRSTEGLGTITAKGAVEGRFAPEIARDAAGLCQADALLLALPNYGHKAVIDALAPNLRPDQPVLISSHGAFGALYLAARLADLGMRGRIVAMGTTVVTGRRSGEGVQVNTVRNRVDMCTLPAEDAAAGLDLCTELFGERFVLRDGLVAITLSNLNPQNHMGIALANMSRMERSESWSQGQNVTPNVGRLLEALDAERLALCARVGADTRTIFEHFHLSFHVPIGPISEMNQEMFRKGTGGTGPATADSRYVTEDVPFGLVTTARLARLAGTEAPLHEAGIRIFSAMYGRDFAAENDLLDALELETMDLATLREVCRTGPPAGFLARNRRPALGTTTGT